MVSNRIAVGALSLACIAAAGAGGYLATLHEATPVAAPAASVPAAVASVPAPAVPADASVSEPVAMSEHAPVAQSPAPQVAEAAGSTPIVKRPAGPSAGQRKAIVADRNRTLPPTPAAVRERTPEPAASAHPTVGASNADTQPLAARVEALQAEAPREAAAPREPEFAKRPATVEELVVSADSVIGLQLETSVNSEQARIEDRVDARVVRDVRVDGSVAVAAGSRAVGTVVVVERGGRFRERARLGIRFHTLMLADGTSLPINTDTIYRLGDGPGTGTAARIGGGAVVGAIIGGIIGGGKGAAIGATTGAGAGTASVMSSDRNIASFPAGAEVTARILSPVTVTIERQ